MKRFRKILLGLAGAIALVMSLALAEDFYNAIYVRRFIQFRTSTTYLDMLTNGGYIAASNGGRLIKKFQLTASKKIDTVAWVGVRPTDALFITNPVTGSFAADTVLRGVNYPSAGTDTVFVGKQTAALATDTGYVWILRFPTQ